jgi:hypothetical protein
MRILVVLALIAACGDNVRPMTPGDAATTPDAAVQPLAACLDRPTDLPRPPAGQLPCELLPPGLMLP